MASSARSAGAACCGASSSSSTGRRGGRSRAERNFTRRPVGRLRDNNVLVAAGLPNANFGKDGDHIQVSPPLTISLGEIDQLIGALDAGLAAVVERAKPAVENRSGGARRPAAP